LEGTGEQQWKDQRWGLHFTEMASSTLPLSCPFLLITLFFLQRQEDDFMVYEPYCANYTNASEIMLAEEQNLMVRRS
jgi:cell division control protein 24